MAAESISPSDSSVDLIQGWQFARGSPPRLYYCQFTRLDFAESRFLGHSPWTWEFQLFNFENLLESNPPNSRSLVCGLAVSTDRMASIPSAKDICLEVGNGNITNQRACKQLLFFVCLFFNVEIHIRNINTTWHRSQLQRNTIFGRQQRRAKASPLHAACFQAACRIISHNPSWGE